MKAYVEGTLILSAILVLASGAVSVPLAQEIDRVPDYLSDRGTGVASSMFGTYIRRGDLLIYPYFEYYYDNDAEYSPRELGYGLDRDLKGRLRASEWLIFLGYGLTDWLAVEFEAAMISESLEKSPDDPTAMPEKIEESGLGDVESQIRARLVTETAGRPELFSFFECVFPTQAEEDVLIGTRDWELTLGFGMIKGFNWGTTTLRAAAGYEAEEDALELGEYAVEYLKRVSANWRVFLALEGTQDEIEAITEAQWHISERVFVKLNNAFGMTWKATDWAPEVGVVFIFPTR